MTINSRVTIVCGRQVGPWHSKSWCRRVVSWRDIAIRHVMNGNKGDVTRAWLRACAWTSCDTRSVPKEAGGWRRLAAHNACLLGDAYLKLQRYIPDNPLDQLLEIRATAAAAFSYPFLRGLSGTGLRVNLRAKGRHVRTRVKNHPSECTVVINLNTQSQDMPNV